MQQKSLQFMKNLQKCGQLQFAFSSNQKQILGNMNKLSQKLQLKQTVADKQKLSSFLNQQTTSGKLSQNITRTSNYDTQFKEFLKEYNAKNNQNPKILDLSHYMRESNQFNQSQQLREDEITMLEEFRKRRQQSIAQGLGEEKDGVSLQDMDQSELEGQGEVKLSMNDDFITLLIENDVTTLTTKLNRVNHFRYLVFMGNANGVIGYGKGKGNDFEEALDNAMLHCKKNLIAVPLDHFMSFPQELSAKYNDVKLKMYPRDSFNSWGNPVLASMILLTGVTHCSYKLTFRNMNPYAMIYCYFKLITQNLTPRDLCEQKGVKVYRENFGKPIYFENMPYMRV